MQLSHDERVLPASAIILDMIDLDPCFCRLRTSQSAPKIRSSRVRKSSLLPNRGAFGDQRRGEYEYARCGGDGGNAAVDLRTFVFWRSQ